ncbi:MAG: hypothetical protein EXR82_08085 [Gammaproteobacteria bacterium]|nr:hypothetical protein [Gammaproteobacteria bacterium]
MKNIRLPLAALLTPLTPLALAGILGLGILLTAGGARAALTLDTGFGTSGIAQVNIDAGPDVARDLAEQLDGSLVLAGRSQQTTAGPTTIDYVTLTRLEGVTGAVDGTFGTAGIVTFLPGLTATTGGGGDGRALAIQPLDQKLVVAGTWKDSAAASSQVFVARFGTNGVLDPGFGTDGVVLFTPAGVTDPTGNAIALRSDGSIVVAGGGTAAGTTGVGFVSVLTSTGAIDPSYALAVVPNSLAAPAGANFGFNAVAALPGDGVLAGGGGGDLTLAQFTSAGVPDTSFSDDGVATVNFLTFDTAQGPNPSFDVVTALTVLSDNRILIAGRAGASSTGTATNRVLGRFTAAGALDSTFGSGGFAPLVDASATEIPEGLGVRPSGDIVLVGQGFTPTQISPNGITVVGITGTYTPVLSDLTVLPDGNIAVAGQTALTGDTAFAASRIVATDLPDGADVVPDPFAFTTQTGLEPGFIVTSNAVTITGIAVPAAISVSSGDLYAIGCTPPFVTAAGTISNGQTVCVKTNAALPDLSAKSAFLIVGGVVGQFTLVTGDSTPDQFTFVNQTDVVANTQITSAPITLSGLTTATDVRVTPAGSTYSIGCTATYVGGIGTATNGAQICVRQASNAFPGGITETRLFVGVETEVQATFRSTTAGVSDTTPADFSFVDQTGVALSTVITSAPVIISGLNTPAPITVTGGTYAIGCTAPFTAVAGTISDGQSVCVRQTSSAAGLTVTSTTLTIGGVADTFTSTTLDADTTPEAFSFVDQTGVNPATQITSAPVTITGITAPTAVSVVGGAYSVGCTATFVNVTGTISNGQSVCVRQLSSALGTTPVTTTLTVGGVADGFISTTRALDTTPAPFSFVDQTGVPLGATITSGIVVISGYEDPTSVTVSAGSTYSINCTATFTASPGTLQPPSARVCVRQTSPVTTSTVTSTVLTAGGVSGTFTSTTLAGDAIPADFNFTNQTGVDLFATITSAPVTITGIDVAIPVSVTGGEYSSGCTNNYATTPGNITSGQTLCVRQTSSFNSLTDTSTTITVGATSRTFTSTTKAGDQTPDDFSFAPQSNVALRTEVFTDAITISGVDSPVAVQVTGPTTPGGQRLSLFSIGCTGTYDGQDGDVAEPGDTLCLIVLSAATDSTSQVVTVTIGGNQTGNQKSATFTVTTGETVPDEFFFTDRVGVLLDDTVYADPITITGITAPSKIEISQNGQYQLNCRGAWTASNGLVANAETLCVRQVAAASLATLTDTVLTVGGYSDTFTSTTVVEKPLPGGSAMDIWALGLLAPLVAYRRRRSALRRDSTIDRA